MSHVFVVFSWFVFLFCLLSFVFSLAISIIIIKKKKKKILGNSGACVNSVYSRPPFSAAWNRAPVRDGRAPPNYSVWWQSTRPETCHQEVRAGL